MPHGSGFGSWRYKNLENIQVYQVNILQNWKHKSKDPFVLLYVSNFEWCQNVIINILLKSCRYKFNFFPFWIRIQFKSEGSVSRSGSIQTFMGSWIWIRNTGPVENALNSVVRISKYPGFLRIRIQVLRSQIHTIYILCFNLV